MFRLRSEENYQEGSEGGVRNLFSLGPYEFHDTMGREGELHHYIVEPAADEGPGIYEVDRQTMYEFMARFLAGHYELKEYHLEHSRGHDELLDVLEMVTARARAGESGFSWEEFDNGDTELLNGEPPEPSADDEVDD